MTRDDLIRRIAEEMPGISIPEARRLILLFVEGMKKGLTEAENLEFRRFGVFEVHHRKPRTARNPRTGASVQVGSRRSLVFRQGKVLKARMKNLTKRTI
jgi:integration host factor subunit beta